MGQTETRYHVAIDVDDRAGVLAAVAQAFAEHGVSIQTVRQEGRGDDAQLVVVSHRATDAALSATVETLRGMPEVRDVSSVMRVEGEATSERADRLDAATPHDAHQWRGVIEEYRDWLPLPDGTPTFTLREGGTPLVDSPWLSGLTGADVWIKVEGDNPTGSFKDRGMTVALSVAVGQGAEAVVCASTGNTSASMAAYAARAKVKPLVLVPQGKIAAGKLAQAIVHGAQVIMVRGNFDDCLRISRELAEHYPVALVNSVNPFRLEGQKTASFEIVDFLGDAPDVHVLPVGNAGNISAYWKGYVEYAEAGLRQRAVRGCSAGRPRAPRRSCSASRCRARDGRLGDPDRQPRLLAPRGRRGRELRRPVRPRRPTRRSCTPSASSPPTEGIFVEPGSAASVAGLLKDVAAGARLPRADDGRDRDRARAQGHRHRAVDVHRPRRHRRRGRRRRGRRRRRAALSGRPWLELVDGAGAGPGAGEQRQPRARVRRARARAGAARRGHGRGRRRGRPVVIEVDGEGADDRAARRDATWCTGRWCAASRRSACRAARRAPALRSTPIPHGRGLGSSSAAIVAGLGARSRPRRRTAEPWPDDATLFGLAAELEGHPDNVAPAVFGGFTIAYGDDGGRSTRSGSRSTPPVGVRRARARRSRCTPTVARGLLPGRRSPHADAAHNAGRAALLVAALTGPTRPAAARRPRTGCTRPTAPRRCRQSAALIAALAEPRCRRGRLRRRARRCSPWSSPAAVADVRRPRARTAGGAGASSSTGRRPVATVPPVVTSP